MSESPAQPGDLIAGKYRVERVLGAGAMGVVVSAIHIELLEHRALKIMLEPSLGDSTRAERFVREARALAKVKSEHVAAVHDIGRMHDGAPYIVMELLDGRDLKAVLDIVGKLSISDTFFLMKQACTGVAAAHALGIVHRDLKPANLFLTKPAQGQTPVLKIVDFGIAKVAGQSGDMEITKEADLLGTPLYMSPEQMRGATSVDARTDIWALGAILYRMLTGRTPFEGTSVTEICAAVVADDPPMPRSLVPEIPEALEQIIMRCLEKRPDRRFSSAEELRDALAAAAQTSPERPLATPASSPELSSGGGPLAQEGIAAPPVLTTPGLQATLNSTSQGTSWAQPSAVTSPARSRTRLFVIAAVGVAGIAAATAVAMKNFSSSSGRSGKKSSATASAQVRGDATTPVAPPSVVVASPTAAVTSAPIVSSASSLAAAPPTSSQPSASSPGSSSAPPSAERHGPPPPVVVRPTAPVLPPPVYVPPPPPPPTDAFGRERK